MRLLNSPALSAGRQPTSSAQAHPINLLLQEWRPFIEKIATARTRPGVERDDLLQAGYIGLLRAQANYDHLVGDERKRCFGRVITNAIRAAVRTEIPYADHASLDLDEPLDRAHPDLIQYPDAPDSIAATQLAVHIHRWLSSLPNRELQLLQLTYFEDLVQREAALRLAISQPRLAQLHAELIRKARDELHYLAN